MVPREPDEQDDSSPLPSPGDDSDELPHAQTADSEKQNFVPQLLLAFTASLGYLTVGLIRGWSSTGVPSLLETSPHVVPTSSVVSWASSVPPLGAFFASLMTGPVLQRLGRKKTLLIAAPVFTASWVMIGLSGSSAMLIGGRLLTGVSAGIVLPTVQIYVCECAHSDIRGILGSLPALFAAIGILISYVAGAWLSWDKLALMSALFPLALTVLMLPLPESPSWLHSRGRGDQARDAAKWLRRKSLMTAELVIVTDDKGDRDSLGSEDEIDVETKLNTRHNSISSTKHAAMQIKQAPLLPTSKPPRKLSIEKLFRRPVMVPFILVSVVLVFQQLSGIDTVLFYTVSIFVASGSPINKYLATTLVGLVQVVSTIGSMFIVDRYGRKPLLLFSGFFMGISMTALAYYFYAHSRGLPIVSKLGLLPVSSLMVFIAAYAVGYCCVPYILMAELLPLHSRSLLSSAASALNVGAMFLVIKTYHDIEHVIGNAGAFFGYACICFLSCVFVFVFIPETKGKSFDEIEAHFEFSSHKLQSNGMKTKTTNVSFQQVTQNV